MSWREFIRSHMEVLAAVDFFTTEVWTAGGLMTYYVLMCMRVATRSVCIAGITPSPDKRWMDVMGGNLGGFFQFSRGMLFSQLHRAHAPRNGKSCFISSLSGLRPYSQISKASANLIFSARSFP